MSRFPLVLMAADERERFAAPLAAVHAEPGDLDLRPDRWPTRFTLPSVENVLNDPLSAAEVARKWTAALRGGRGIDGPLRWAAGELGGVAPHGPDVKPALLSPRSGIPSEVLSSLSRIMAALSLAYYWLDQSSESLPPVERERLVSALLPILTDTLRLPADGAVYDVAERFDVKALLRAAGLAAQAVEEQLPALDAFSDKMRNAPRARWRMDRGDVLISGEPDAVFTSEDIERAALLIHWGRSSRYSGAPARALSGQIRAVIDFSRDVIVESSGTASGVFGVGLLYLPSATGRKVLSGGDVSLGAGLFGVGGLSVAGPVEMSGAGFTQGAGAFGVGILDARGDGGRFTANYAGQGFGFTRGIGVFRHQGDGAALDCGLVYPDPHEPQAAISLCQGMGFGPRAFAAGGIGIAVLDGNRSRLRSNYQSQGSGYWRGMGVLAVTGDENNLQARRYGQGAGVHAAAGVLALHGNRNSTAHWGVGPAFGWDYGVGLWEARGDDNTFYAGWGTGRGDANGHGLAVIEGNRNKMSLPDFGSGYMRRLSPGYGLAAIRGRDNRFRLPQAGRTINDPVTVRSMPWGAMAGDSGLILDPELTLPEPSWPPVARETQQAKEREFLMRSLEEADRKQGAERIAGWLSVPAWAQLDGATPAQAVARLLSLDARGAVDLLGLMNPERFDESLWGRTILASFGGAVSREIISEFRSSIGTRRSLMAGLLASLPAADATAPTLEALKDTDWRVRRQGVAVLGLLFGREEGEEPGRLRFLELSAVFCRAAPPGSEQDAALQKLGNKRLSDLYAALALDFETSAQERVSLFSRTPNPFDTVGQDSLREYARILASRGGRCEAPLRRELESAGALSGRARFGLLEAAKDPDRSVRAAALAGLGQLGDARDAPVLAKALEDPSAEVREAAGLGLAKMGGAAKSVIEKALRSPVSRVRALAALAAAQSSDTGVIGLVRGAMADADEDVRLTAVTSLGAVQSVNQSYRRNLLETLDGLAEKDPSASVRATARYVRALCR